MPRFLTFVAVLVIAALCAPAAFGQPPCRVPDDGSGTVTLPPKGCGYLSPADFHMIIAGLPAGTTIIVKPIHGAFICGKGRETGCVIGGTPETGEVEEFESTIRLHLEGRGGLAGYNRVIDVPAKVTTRVGPRRPGKPVQQFETEMVSLSGSITGDRDFAVLNIEAGSANGLPSPGSTVLTQLDDGTWQVDSKFEVGYRISFEGADDSLLRGSGGTTEERVTMTAAGVDIAPSPDADR